MWLMPMAKPNLGDKLRAHFDDQNGFDPAKTMDHLFDVLPGLMIGLPGDLPPLALAFLRHGDDHYQVVYDLSDAPMGDAQMRAAALRQVGANIATEDGDLVLAAFLSFGYLATAQNRSDLPAKLADYPGRVEVCLGAGVDSSGRDYFLRKAVLRAPGPGDDHERVIKAYRDMPTDHDLDIRHNVARNIGLGYARAITD